MVDVLEVLYERARDLERLVDGCRRKMAALESDLSAARAILRLHAQDVRGKDFSPHMSPRRLFKRSEIFEYCREALMQVSGALDTRELTRAVITRKGLDADDPVLRRKIVFSVSSALLTAKRHRRVEAVGRRGGVRLWKLREARPFLKASTKVETTS